MNGTTDYIHSDSPAGNREATIEQALGKIFTDRHANAIVVDTLQTMYRYHKYLLLTSPIQSLIYRFGTNVGSPTFLALENTSVSKFERPGTNKLVNIDHLWRIPGRLIRVEDTINLRVNWFGRADEAVNRRITLIDDHQDEVGLEHMHCIMFSRNGHLEMMVPVSAFGGPNDGHYFYNEGKEVDVREGRAIEAIPRVNNASASMQQDGFSDHGSEFTVDSLVRDTPAATSTAGSDHEDIN
ncbi:hypothetical protein OCU04_006574 [Sclerotinia nivalis]|uniref:Uncharacterized protein n=1 Tax=Sclerotinia nivalis TaxID=352851 RepID=A0A9X0AK17_9HELO|nr:hypothetical protein OCU04_006574 [Sclerotinia nivalis]